MDILPPDGCDVGSMTGEFLSPATGFVVEGPRSYNLNLPQGTFIAGTEYALMFAGIQEPNLHKIVRMQLTLAHVRIATGNVGKGQSIGDLVPDDSKNPWKAAYQVKITYDGILYFLSPTLFVQDVEWECPPINNNCEPIPLYYGE